MADMFESDTFELTLNNPLTEEQWDEIADVDFDRTDRITFHTKHGKEVEFVKARHGKWIDITESHIGTCSLCGDRWGSVDMMNYCPSCGARMDEE